MARSKAARFKSRKLSDEELLEAQNNSLTTLQHLTKVYDDGYHPVCFLMATEVEKIVVENKAAIRARKSRRFSTVDLPGEHDKNILSAVFKLTIGQLAGDPPSLSFLPAFCSGEIRKIREVAFVEWWHRDIIYRASAAPAGLPPGAIPLNGALSVPFSEREKINRMDFVHLLRLKLGAHQSDDMPELLDQLSEAKAWGAFQAELPSGTYSALDGTLPTRVPIMAAMMRQIAHEVLVAYDRDDPPTCGPTIIAGR